MIRVVPVLVPAQVIIHTSKVHTCGTFSHSYKGGGVV